VADPILAIRNLSKTFPGNVALRNVSIEIMPGEVHALVGQNGSGKSTLVKCLSGYHQPDNHAEIIVGGVRLPAHYSSSQAHGFGLAFVHQDLGLIPSLSVLENFCLARGFATGAGYHIRWQEEARRVQKLMAEFEHDISPRALVGSLSSGDQTIVAIVRALQEASDNGHVLVLDEPTAALPEREVGEVFAAIRRTAARGVGVIYVSHRLREIYELAERVTVLRDGQRVGTFQVADLDERNLVELMVGQTIEQYYPPAQPKINEDVLLRVENLSGSGLKGVSFSIQKGEIVGVSGLLGSGCSELGRLLFGASQRTGGTISFKGKDVSFGCPGDAIRRGIGLVTEDRRHDGFFPLMSVGENVTITDLRRFSKWGRLKKDAERREILGLIDEFRVNPPDPERAFCTLSGGNQQKAIIAKWMRLKPDLMILDEPMRGIDVGSKTEVCGLMQKSVASGAGVLLISSEFEDMAYLCDRVLVMSDGRLVAELAGQQLTKDSITHLVYLSAARGEDHGISEVEPG